MKTNDVKEQRKDLRKLEDRTVNIHSLKNPRQDTNTSEGCEYLDDRIRMKEQPFSEVVLPGTYSMKT